MRAGRSVNGAVMGLVNNRVLKTRLAGVGMLSRVKVLNYGISGVIARSGGARADLRIGANSKYGAYWNCSFRTFLGKRGDNLDRFLIRIKETFESFRLGSQIIASLLNLSVPHQAGSAGGKLGMQPLQHAGLVNLEGSKTKFSGMEEVIRHFKQFSEGLLTLRGFNYCSVEAPKGELGVALVASGQSKPYRIKIRTPVSHNMHMVSAVCVGAIFGDFVMTFCSFDIVLGEIDR